MSLTKSGVKYVAAQGGSAQCRQALHIFSHIHKNFMLWRVEPVAEIVAFFTFFCMDGNLLANSHKLALE